MDEVLAEKLRLYALAHQLRIGRALGSGHQGSVFVAERNANAARFALKIFKEAAPFLRELRAYEILTEHGVTEIEGFWVPQFLGADRKLLGIEMSIVDPPYLLDFGGAYEGRYPEFPDNVWEEWREQKREEFGERWPIVEDVLMVLRSYGIFLIDIHPRNIVFRVDV